MKDIEDPATSPRDRAALARALDCVLERKRVMRMKPAPRPVDVSQPRPAKRMVSFEPVPAKSASSSEPASTSWGAFAPTPAG